MIPSLSLQLSHIITFAFFFTQTVTKIRLTNNGTRDERAPWVADALYHNKVILNLPVTTLSTSSFVFAQTLTTLDLSWNAIGLDVITRIAHALKHNIVMLSHSSAIASTSPLFSPADTNHT